MFYMSLSFGFFYVKIVLSVVSCCQAMWCSGSDVSLGNERIRFKTTLSHGDFGQETQPDLPHRIILGIKLKLKGL